MLIIYLNIYFIIYYLLNKYILYFWIIIALLRVYYIYNNINKEGLFMI